MPNARQDRADEPHCQTYPGLVQQIKAMAETAAGENAYLLRTTVQHRGLGVVAISAPRYAANQDAIRNTNVLLAGATPVENDPGVAATVTIDGLGGSRAEAVDVLSRSSQELITSARTAAS